MTLLTQEFTNHWLAVQPILTVQNEAEYETAVHNLNQLLDHIGTDESHPLYSVLDTLGTLILAYEEEHEQIPESSGVETLAFLMEEHNLRQSDLPEVGSQGVVSEILSGKRELNVRQIRALSQRFGVSPAVVV